MAWRRRVLLGLGLGLTFGIGLLLGCLVIAGWLWLNSANSTAWQFDLGAQQPLTAPPKSVNPPEPESSLLTLLLSEPSFVFGVLFAAAPLLAAVAFVMVPRVWPKRKESPEELPLQAAPSGQPLEELLDDIELEQPAQKLAEETEEEEAEEEKPKEQEAEAQSSGLGDLASLFEEEDTSVSTLEVFCKSLAEVNMDELLANYRGLARQLREANALRAGQMARG